MKLLKPQRENIIVKRFVTFERAEPVLVPVPIPIPIPVPGVRSFRLIEEVTPPFCFLTVPFFVNNRQAIFKGPRFVATLK